MDDPSSAILDAFKEMDLKAPPFSGSFNASQVSPKRAVSDPFVIAVAGGTASGKTTVCDLIIQRLHDQCVVVINQDSFYRALNDEQKSVVATGDYNFDSPDAVDEAALLECLDALKRGQPYEVPIYDFATHARSTTESRRIDSAQVIIVEGILVLHFASILERAHMKIFVDSDDDVRLARRIQRDVAHRGRDVAGVIQQYTRFVKPSHDDFIAPSRRTADIIIPWQRGDNLVAVDLIVGHLRSHIVSDALLSQFPSLHLVESTFQMRGMHTIVRNRDTDKGEFIFMADRLIRLVIEYALGLLPTKRAVVKTPTDAVYTGLHVNATVCGVSIIRSGEAMENALRSCWKGIDIGKILVQRRHHGVATPGTGSVSPTRRNSAAAPGDASGENGRAVPLAEDAHGTYYQRRRSPSDSSAAEGDALIYEKLPHDIASRHVLLMDPVLGTGNTAARAVRVLLDRGVDERRIQLLTLIASRQGVQHVMREAPGVQIITTEIDPEIDRNYRVVPGVGEFGDRYFCA